ncbi:tetratricopeptide repeat protein [Polynucleobacter paneuropaeus]|uniref:O-linked N-acetylglucosamine transferase, SPINDLY family protein n=1 Tax=Polynucleobacter paneuropaeus TaxID=2527775 RepID=UPI001BFD992A|nr:tetratricopeptide repeat protein [Polynucleobacter paneuropaeus]MBT8621680.1 tetratricopeptide repeat protein [Polynucleobacter paneuropaeus]
MNISSNLLPQAIADFQAGNFRKAQLAVEKILTAEPLNWAAKELLAYLYANQGESSKALGLLKEITDHPQSSVSALYEYGSLLIAESKPNDAIPLLEKALAQMPNSFEVLHDLATALAKVGRKTEALEQFQQAAKINGESSELFYNVGRLHDDLYQEEEAIACYKKSLMLSPDYVQSWINLGVDLSRAKKYDESQNCFKRALEIDPNVDFLLGDSIQAEMNMGSWSSYSTNIKKLKDGIRKQQTISHPFTVISLLDDPALQKEAAEIYAQKKWPKQSDVSSSMGQKNKKVKIAYFSADFRYHPIAHLIMDLLECHDLEQFEIYAFSWGPTSKSLERDRIISAVHEFIDINEYSDQQVVDLARGKGIDIAIDLGGYTQSARTDLFAMRVAPIQVSYLGYIGTMGVNFIDYIIADEILVPKHHQKYFSEKIIYMPDCFQVSDRKRVMGHGGLRRADYGLPEKGFIYCCFNNNYKMTPEVFDSWMRILLSVEGGVLWLYESNALIAQQLKSEAKARGVDPARLVFGKMLPQSEYLARYQIADLFLDTFPYNAGTTANDALWTGLPVLTRMGSSMASRMAASLLNTLGLSELITKSAEAYEAVAIELGNNPEQIDHIREKLEKSKISSQLFNTPLFARNLEKLLQQVYERSHSGLAPDHIRLN